MAQQYDSGDMKEQPLGDLLRQLAQDTASLVRQEMDLAKAEFAQTGKKAGLGAGLVGAAGLTALLALGAFTAAVVLLLNLVMPAWLGALLVALVYAAVAAVLALKGKDKVQEATPPAPQTVETVKEDVQWAKNPTRSVNR